MNPEQHYYATTARHYDPAYAAMAPDGDQQFYVALAKRIGGPVLEVGCGTGRILIPTAQAGIEIDGLDFTPQLLDIARSKLTPELVGRVTLHQGDMRDFELPRRYRLITVPFRPLQHLVTIDDQVRALSSMHRHLEPGGFLAFNVFFPRYRLLDEPLGAEYEEASWTDPQDPSVTVTRFFRRTSVDRLRQVFQGQFIYRFYKGGSQVDEERSAFRLCWYTYPHLELLLRHTGFRIAEQYGTFSGQPIDVCEEMILVAATA